MSVKIQATPDRYLVVDSDTGENMDDDAGFSDPFSARRWAEREGYEIEDDHGR